MLRQSERLVILAFFSYDTGRTGVTMEPDLFSSEVLVGTILTIYSKIP